MDKKIVSKKTPKTFVMEMPKACSPEFDLKKLEIHCHMAMKADVGEFPELAHEVPSSLR